MKEKWKNITYRDIERDRYQVSNLGHFRKIKSGRILYGCNPKNERGGYCRISLKSMSGKIKKYQMHQIVVYEFGEYYDEYLEINHKDGNKLNNAITNLECSTRKENAEHAAIHDLYQNCERHYRANFTNEQVESICRLISEGHAVSEVVDILDLREGYGDIFSNIDKIINGKSWKKISSKYTFDKTRYHYKTYKYEDIVKMCECIFIDKMKNKDIAKLFPQYNEKNLRIALKSIKAGRIYKDVSKNYLKLND